MGDLIQISKNMFKGLNNYNSNDISTFMTLQTEDRLSLFAEKDKQYGGSWQKDGVIGAFLNLKRKIDRLLNKWHEGELFDFSDDSLGESNLDTLMDMDNYSQMLQALLFLSCSDEEVYNRFVKKYPKVGECFLFDEIEKRPKLR